MKLLIRNLARTTTETELRALFEAYGRVQSCVLVVDKETGQSKGFGFVEMPKPGEAKVAVKSLNGKVLAECKIRVKKAESKPDVAATPVTKQPEPIPGEKPWAQNARYAKKTEAKKERKTNPYGKRRG